MLDRLSAREPGPEEIYLAGELQERLRREVGALPDHYRAVIILHHYQNLSYREISEILDLPVRTVETRLYRAKAILKEKLQDLTQGGEPNGLPRSQKVLAQLP
ncbi:MAG: sigma-70 family RNA polymerase sigma factor [Actinobacteria bacterium]|nr:sigma-70 family RNA polymerase sigma factor [Actinomycetota bacterium]